MKKKCYISNSFVTWAKRRNIPVTYKTVVLVPYYDGYKNVLTQDVINEENIKYVIKHDYWLNGETITVPENSILEFDGGILHDGTIIGQDTSISDIGGLGLEKLFAEDIVREGTWRTKGVQVQSDWNQTDSQLKDFIKNKPNLAEVATSGSYNDLNDKPTIPAEQIQSDWNETDVNKKSFIKNKPTIPEEVTVDIELSKTSTNPVQNKVIAEALEKAGNTNKPYDPTKHSGLGRKTLKLKKNGSNVLTQEDFDDANTIYVIQYDFILSEDITIPENCVLEFEGGSISGNYKIISNETKIFGAYESSINSFYGAFYNLRGEFLYKNSQVISSSKITLINGNLGIEPSLSSYTLQSLCVTEYNIFTCHNNENESIGAIKVYDRNYNYLGYVKVEYMYHANGCTTDGIYVYIAATDANSGDSRILKININEIIGHFGSTITPDTVDGVKTNYIRDAISYDFETEEFAVAENYKPCIYDKNWHLLRTGIDVREKYRELTGYDIIPQGHVYTKGVIYFFWLKSQYNSWRGNSVCIVYDTVRDKIIHSIDILSPYSNLEIESGCIDPKTGLFIMPGMRSFSVVTFTLEDEEIIQNKFQVRSNGDYTYGNYLADTTTPLSYYIDNTYTGISCGNGVAPFKSIREAIQMMNKKGRYILKIKRTNVPYDEGNIVFNDIHITIEQWGDNHFNFSGNLNFYNCNVVLNGIDFQTNYLSTRTVFDNCSGKVSNCSCDISYDDNYFTYIYQSNIIFDNVIITSNNNTITAGVDVWMKRVAFGVFTQSLLTITNSSFKNINVFYLHNNSTASKIYMNHKDNNIVNCTLDTGDATGTVINYGSVISFEQYENLINNWVPYCGYNHSEIKISTTITLSNGALIPYGYCRIDGGKLTDSDRGNQYSLVLGSRGPLSALSGVVANLIGQTYFDTTNSRPLWSNGSNWVDATGTIINFN